MTTITLSSGTTVVIPVDWGNPSKIQCFGAAGGCSGDFNFGTGGAGGGAYAETSNPIVVIGNTYSYSIGAAGSSFDGTTGTDGGDTFFGSTMALALTGAAPGKHGIDGNGTPGAGGAGGTSGSSVGAVKFSGGSGGAGNDDTTGGGDGGAGGGGGGCAGPDGPGVNGSPPVTTSTNGGVGGAGDNSLGGAGGAANSGAGGSSNLGGGGGGGGQGIGGGIAAGNGGYPGGGCGGGSNQGGSKGGTPGAGLILMTYTPNGSIPPIVAPITFCLLGAGL